MKIILAQLKYDIQSLEQKMKSVEDTKIKMKASEGKPVFWTCEKFIKDLEFQIDEHIKSIDVYYIKFKNELNK